MKKLIASVIGGLILGLVSGLYVYNFYIGSFPKATDIEKGLVGFLALACVCAVTYLGYRFGKDHDP